MRSKTLDDAKEGDIIASPDGSKCMVLFRIGDCIGRSAWYNFSCFQEIKTIYEMKQAGFQMLIEGKEPITIQEAEKLLLGKKIIK